MEQNKPSWLDILSHQEDCTVLSVSPNFNSKGVSA